MVNYWMMILICHAYKFHRLLAFSLYSDSVVFGLIVICLYVLIFSTVHICIDLIALLAVSINTFLVYNYYM